MLEWLFGGSFSPEHIPSQEGRVLLVTGGNNGLGKETVLQLAKHNPHATFLAARNVSKAEAARAEIQSAVPGARIELLTLDLSSFDSIKAAAKDFQSRSDRLDLLMNNAGVAGVPFSLTKDGYETQFGTNHMGHATLTKLLLPTMLKTAELPNADVRIINVSSKGHMFAPAEGIIFDPEGLRSKGDMARYGRSKLANILHARALQKHYPSITTMSVHPGVIVTDIYASLKEGSGILRLAMPAVQAIAPYGVLPDTYDVPKGTWTQLWAATAPAADVRKGYYFTPFGVRSAGTKSAQNDDLVDRLWSWTDEELSKHGI